jgi:N-acetylglucosaminyldiphosphoundecaprenol N-acetyl-beta-D-mannosaminyltransferase
MKLVLFENIKLCCPKDIDETKNIFNELTMNKETKYISFINPEIFLHQQKDKNLHTYFANSAYNFIDGVGLFRAINAKLNTKYKSEDRYTGTDFFNYLPDKNLNVFLFGSYKENLENACINITKKFPNIKIVGTFDGYTNIDDLRLIEVINSRKPDILIVCLGCPLQEYWISKNIDNLKVPLIFGNGGAVDFWSGKIKRAPKFILKIGCEFIYRLLQDFSIKRIKRQLKLLKFYISYKFNKYDICLIETETIGGL